MDSGNGGVAGDGTCANDDNDRDVVTVVVMVMMVVMRMLVLASPAIDSSL